MRRFFVGAISLGLALVTVGAAAPAHAAGDISVSDDGVTYGSSYPGALFDSVGILVPLDSESESFYMRNDTGQAGFLRIVLRDVTYSEPALGAAVSVSASTPADAGQPVALTAATPCAILVEGQLVQPNTVVPITAVLALADLSGSTGQNGSVSLTMRIELHDVSTGHLPAGDCSSTPGVPGTDVVVVPPNRPGSGDAAVPETQPEAEGEEPDGGNSGVLPGQNQGNIEPNTWLLYEERWWFVMLLAFVVGSLTFMIVDWRRRGRGLEDDTETGA